jgi:hypothetical protein
MTDPIFPQPSAPQDQQQGQPQYAAYPPQQQQYAMPPTQPGVIDPNRVSRHELRHVEKGTSGLAIAALVLGIIAVVLSWVPIVNNFAAFLAVIGLVFGIIGIVKTGAKGRKKGRGLAIAGTVLSIVAIIVTFGTQAFYGKTLDKASQSLSSASASISKQAQSPAQQQSNPSPAAIPDLTGSWKQENATDASSMEATVTGDAITVNWHMGDTTAVYWQGTFTPPTAGGDYTWTSAADTVALSQSLLGSQDPTKDFAYENGQITFDVTSMGVTTHVRMNKQ